MSRGSHTLLYTPSTGEIVCSPPRPLAGPDAIALHRTLGPELGFGTAHAEVGVGLLPEGEQPAFGASLKLLWVPILPSKCLLTAEDERGVLRILTRDPKGRSGGELARTMERLEVACAFGFEEALSESPEPRAVLDHLDEALEQALLAILLFADQAAPSPFWKREAAAS